MSRISGGRWDNVSDFNDESGTPDFGSDINADDEDGAADELVLTEVEWTRVTR